MRRVLDVGHDVQLLVEGGGDQLDRLLVAGHHQEREEAVHLAGDAVAVDGHAGLLQPVGVRLALVAQHVVLGGQHDGRRQPGEVRRLQRRRVGLGPACRVGQVVVPEPDHRVARQHQLVLVGGVGRVVEVGVGHGVDEGLERDRRTATVARPLGHDRRQVAAGRVTADDDRHVAAGDVGHVLVDPLERGVGVVDGDRVAVLRRQAVVHEDHRAAGAGRELAPERVELVDVAADDPAATVVVDEHATRRVRRHEDPRRDRRAVDGDRRVLDPRHVRARPVERAELGGEAADLLRGALVDRFHALLRHLREECGQRIVERHRAPLSSLGRPPTTRLVAEPLPGGARTYSDVPTIGTREEVHRYHAADGSAAEHTWRGPGGDVRTGTATWR